MNIYPEIEIRVEGHEKPCLDCKTLVRQLINQRCRKCWCDFVERQVETTSKGEELSR